MLNRLFALKARLGLFLISIGLVGLVGAPASAALQKFILVNTNIQQYLSESPEVANSGPTPGQPDGVVLVDDSGANPILVKYKTLGRNFGVTLILPSLGGFLYVRQLTEAGPAANQVGTGSTASSIDWGNTDGWTTSNASFCHSVPSAICTIASRVDLATIVAPLVSDNYDHGTWIFHGTGFTHAGGGYIAGTGRTELGNRRVENRGERIADGTVPAIPLLGIGVVGISIVAMGIAAARRSRE